MRISEIFHSIQGEGQFAGTPSAFLRTTGCNLRCRWCDTGYTSWNPEGSQMGWKEVLARVLKYDCEHVVVTGGEPLLQPEVVPLTKALAAQKRFVTIETAGTVIRDVHADLMSVSPKLSNSTPMNSRWTKRHEQVRNNHDVATQLFNRYRCQLKFVVDCRDDIAEIEAYLARFPQVSPAWVWLMPQGVSVEETSQKTPWLTEVAEERGFRVSPRLHIELFGNTRGT